MADRCTRLHRQAAHPDRRWVWIGILIASGVITFLLNGYALDRFGLLINAR